MQAEYTETIEGVTYTLTIEECPFSFEQEHAIRPANPVDANVFYGMLDPQTQAEIRTRLQAGELWAWCTVRVTATIERAGQRFEGFDALTGCSYKDAEDFVKRGMYYEGMRDSALENLSVNVRAVMHDSGNLSRVAEGVWIEMRGMGMTPERAQMVLLAAGKDADDVETYVFGCDDPEAMFAKFEDESELLEDFESTIGREEE